MTHDELRILLKILLINYNNEDILEEETDLMRNFVDNEAKKLGFTDWTHAYHELTYRG